jgi:hypothetical protein
MEGGDTLDAAATEDLRTWKGELRARLKGRIGERRDGAMDGMEDALDAAAMGRHLECREERVRSAVVGCGRDDVLLNKKESGTKISFIYSSRD